MRGCPSKLIQRLESVRPAIWPPPRLDSRSTSTRWVVLRDQRVMWGDPRSRKIESVLHLAEATSLMHGAQSASFLKQGSGGRSQKGQSPLCTIIVHPTRIIGPGA